MKKLISILLTASMLSGSAAMPFTAIAAETAAETSQASEAAKTGTLTVTVYNEDEGGLYTDEHTSFMICGSPDQPADPGMAGATFLCDVTPSESNPFVMNDIYISDNFKYTIVDSGSPDYDGFNYRIDNERSDRTFKFTENPNQDLSICMKKNYFVVNSDKSVTVATHGQDIFDNIGAVCGQAVKLINSDEFKALDTADRISKAKELMKALSDEELIANYAFDAINNVMKFTYKHGTITGQLRPAVFLDEHKQLQNAVGEQGSESAETYIRSMDMNDVYALQADPTAVPVTDYEYITVDEVFTKLCGGEYAGVCSYNKGSDFFMHTGSNERTLIDQNGKLHKFEILYPELVVKMKKNFKLPIEEISSALAEKGYKAPNLVYDGDTYRLFGQTTYEQFNDLLEMLRDLPEAESVTGHLAVYEDTRNTISANDGIHIGLPYVMDENNAKYKELIEVASSVGYTVGTPDSNAAIGDYQLYLRKEDPYDTTNPYKLFKYLEDNDYRYSTSVMSTCMAMNPKPMYFCNIPYQMKADSTEATMTLAIVETRGDTLILKPDAQYLQNIGERFSLPATCLDGGVIPPIGARLEVTFDKGILETYPAQFGGIKKVRVLSEPAKTVKGDANLDDKTNMADVVLIMQSLANPDKYSENGQAYIHLTTLGKLSADMNGDGLTVGDAQAIQRKLLGLPDDK